MKIETHRASWLHTGIIATLAFTVSISLPGQSSAADSFSLGGNSFSLILAQSQGGFFKRLAEKNRQKKALRQAANNQARQSNQAVQQTTTQNQWNPFQAQQPSQQSNQSAQQTSSLNQWNPFHNPNPQSNQQPAQQTSSFNQWNPFHNPSPQSNQNQTQSTQQAQQSNLNQWNPFHNQQAQQTQGSNENTQTSSNASSRGLTGAERTSLVNYHNQVRAEVGVGQLQWSGQIAAHAQQWADEIARTGNFRHRSNNPYGENLAQGTADYYTVVKLAEMWYGEKRLYSPGKPFSRSDMPAGHYTQMVWRGSTQMGAGKAIITSGRSKGSVVLVCNYAQRGNMIGQMPY